MLGRIRGFRDGFHGTTMFMTLMMWVCLLPLVVLFTLPFFGWQGMLTAAAIALVITLIACWGICSFPPISVKKHSDARRSSVRQPDGMIKHSHSH